MIDLLLDEFDGALVKVVSETGDASVAEQLELVIQLEYLRVLLLAKLISVGLVLVEIIAIIVIIFVLIVSIIKAKVLIIVVTVIEVWPLNQVIFFLICVLY